MLQEERGRDKFKKYQAIIILLTKVLMIIPIGFRLKFFEFFRYVKGVKGVAIRYIILKTITKYCGDNVSIHPNVYLMNPENLVIGNNVSIHPMTYIDAYGEIEIGDDVSIAHGASILSTTHEYESLNVPIKDQGLVIKKTTISNDVWIGSKATILSGIYVHEGAIVGANAVVTKNVEKFSIVGGSPAKLLKYRKRENRVE